MSYLNYTHEDGVATITLDNPPNSRLNDELLQGFVQAVLDLSKRSDTRVVLVKAEGADFSFGADITTWLDHTEESIATWITQSVQVANLLESLPVPVVAAVQGHCLGGAFELVLRMDFIIAADDAKFGHPEATAGMFTGLGGIQRVADRIGRTRAMKMALTSEVIGSQDALDFGLVNEVVPRAELHSQAEEWAARFGGGATLAHAAHKKLLHAWSNGGVLAADALLPELFGKCLVSEDAQGSLLGASEAVKAGKPRPAYAFKGR